MIGITPVPAFSDNYLWVLHDDHHAAVIDPGDHRPVADFLAAHGLQLAAILCTHHHADHVGGVEALLAFAGPVPVFGPAAEAIPARTVAVREGDQVHIDALGLDFAVLEVPGHTAGHVAYWGQGLLFCGDTLFACGCGRLFEGTAAQMTASLSKLRALPAATRFYCAHEYTLSNIRFALAVEPDNAALQARQVRESGRRARGLPTLPATLADERDTNPFLRWDQPAVIAAASRHAGRPLTAPHAVFGALRAWKDDFR
ncbi:MAG: hydroxyacylglutathione hydrolase [Betaproteobacteria bacterium]|nr:hydroxyacylglutathione hydrolase [Betaproteobacteria bacterium]